MLGITYKDGRIITVDDYGNAELVCLYSIKMSI